MEKLCANCIYSSMAYDEYSEELFPTCENENSKQFDGYCPPDYTCDLWIHDARKEFYEK